MDERASCMMCALTFCGKENVILGLGGNSENLVFVITVCSFEEGRIYRRRDSRFERHKAALTAAELYCICCHGCTASQRSAATFERP
jgi:hypothetical protein